MAYLQPAARLVFGGGLLSQGSEIWTCSMGVWSPGGGGNLIDPEVLAPTFRTWFTDSRMKISSGTSLTYIKLNAIDGAGHYVDKERTFEYYYPDVSIPKGSSGAMKPPQCSLAITLGTSVRRGLANRGRFYLPMPGHEITSAGDIFLSATQPTADCTAELISSINRLLGGDYRVSVLSEKGAARQVTNVQVGNIMDTQRRRRNKLEEVYVGADVEVSDLDPGPVIPVDPPGGA